MSLAQLGDKSVKVETEKVAEKVLEKVILRLSFSKDVRGSPPLPDKKSC